MTATRRTSDPQIDRERSRRIDELRSMDRKALSALPEVFEEAIQIRGKRVVLTTYVENDADGRLLVLVRSDEPKLLGLVGYGATDGFWVLPDDTKAEATDTDLMDFFS